MCGTCFPPWFLAACFLRSAGRTIGSPRTPEEIERQRSSRGGGCFCAGRAAKRPAEDDATDRGVEMTAAGDASTRDASASSTGDARPARPHPDDIPGFSPLPRLRRSRSEERFFKLISKRHVRGYAEREERVDPHPDDRI